MKRCLLLLVFLCSCLTGYKPGCATASEVKPVDETLPITAFTDEELARGEPIGWEVHPGICRKILKRAQPRVLEQEGRRILQVKTEDNGIVLLRRVDRKANQYPLLKWSWKVSNILPQSREKEVGGDDYPAAVCIVYAKTFMGIPRHIRGLIYVWGSNVTAGERFTNPCDERFHIIVIKGGPEGVGQWLEHKVNHHQDYIIEFGEVPDKVYAVGIQTNTDRNHGEVEASYADIALTRQ